VYTDGREDDWSRTSTTTTDATTFTNDTSSTRSTRLMTDLSWMKDLPIVTILGIVLVIMAIALWQIVKNKPTAMVDITKDKNNEIFIGVYAKDCYATHLKLSETLGGITTSLKAQDANIAIIQSDIKILIKNGHDKK
jgi:hypothetical protein